MTEREGVLRNGCRRVLFINKGLNHRGFIRLMKRYIRKRIRVNGDKN